MTSPCTTGIFFGVPDAQQLLGTTGQFKTNICFSIVRKRHRNPVLHIGKAKPCMNVVTGIFQSIYSGTHFPVNEFHYQHPNGYWEFTNLTSVSGLLPHPSDDPGIPIMPISHVDRDTVLTSVVEAIAPITGV